MRSAASQSTTEWCNTAAPTYRRGRIRTGRSVRTFRAIKSKDGGGGPPHSSAAVAAGLSARWVADRRNDRGGEGNAARSLDPASAAGFILGTEALDRLARLAMGGHRRSRSGNA